jgi:AMP nucleosidase
VGARNAQNILSPPPVAAERFTDATAAVARLEEIYERNVAFLRESFEATARSH